MNRYKANVQITREATIDSRCVARILEEELDAILGGEDRYIDDKFMIRERDYRSSLDDTIRQVTQEETELYTSFTTAIKYFKQLEWKK